jgi:C-terminal processing protease CtpA/Prc
MVLLGFQVNPASKAEKSGLREGDVITCVNEADTGSMSNAEVKKILKTEDKVDLKIAK